MPSILARVALSIASVTLLFTTGCGLPSLLITPVSGTQDLKEITVQPAKSSSRKIAMIEVEGLLANARTGGFLRPEENKVALFKQQLDLAAKDPAVKAVVLRINSPGGTVTASDIMYTEVMNFRATTHKPVIAAAQDLCTSGAYYVACGADKVVVHPTSVVGSIGVIFQTFNVAGPMSKLGITADAIKSGPMKDMGSPFRPNTPEERQVMQDMVDEFYTRFVAVVQTRKVFPDAATQKLATDGRVFSGPQAVALGLADQVGTLEDAITLAQQESNSPGAKVVMYKRPAGYSGSIYATAPTTPEPTTTPPTVQLQLPTAQSSLAPGFYYLWEP